VSIRQRAWHGVLHLFNWRLTGTLPEPRRYVVVGAPHTSNWDFVLAMALVRALGVRVSILAKSSLFRWPFGWVFRRLGLIPVDRSSANGVVGQAADAFAATRSLVLVVTPEGTRSKTQGWRSGFYRIALAADVPVVPVAVDGDKREVRIGERIRLSGNVTADMDLLRAFYEDARGMRPDRSGPVRLAREE
jgi:1-acyl-sn-glycerol-3-phosphate acyltransferase